MIPWNELGDCCFALQYPSVPHPCAVPEVRPFRTYEERDTWVAQNPQRRQVVGKRNEHVKAYRQAREAKERAK